MELVGPGYRSFVTVMTCTFYTFGIMMLAGVTYIVPNWVEMSLYTSVPFLLYFFYLFIMPESPRWLLAQGRFEDALKILEVMARVNGEKLPNSFRIKLHERVEADKIRVKENVKSWNSFDLCRWILVFWCVFMEIWWWICNSSTCRTPNMRLKTLLITLNWFANETVYLGLSYYGPSLGDSEHLRWAFSNEFIKMKRSKTVRINFLRLIYSSFFLSSMVEIPSYLCCWFIMDKWGRRWPMCLLMISR